jgi:uncharacterized protein Veg
VEQDWTGQIGRRVGMWLSAGLVRTYKAEGVIERVTATRFTVKVDGENKEVTFLRGHGWLEESFRHEYGHMSKRNPSRCYPNPLPKD